MEPLPAPPQPRTTEPLLRFTCSHCGTVLTAPFAHPGISGPCPVCGRHIASPVVATPASASAAAAPDPARSQPRRQPPRIAADSMLDHVHLENRESIRTIKVLALFILTFCACLVAAWLLKRHMAG